MFRDYLIFAGMLKCYYQEKVYVIQKFVYFILLSILNYLCRIRYS